MVYIIPKNITLDIVPGVASGRRFDRGVCFGDRARFAVLLAGITGNWYTTHETARTAAYMAELQREYGPVIIDRQGAQYVVRESELVAVVNDH